MKMKFWRRNTDKHLSAPPEEKARERGYFDSVRNTGMQDHISNDDYKYDVGGPDNAMRLATVYRCVSILSGSIASLPLQLLRKRNGVFMPDEADPLNYLLTLCPNNSQTAFELIKNTIITMVIQGNIHISGMEGRRSGRSRIIERRKCIV